MNELDLFAAAIAIDDSRERDALLDRECAGRPELRLRLDELLVEHFRIDPRSDRPGCEPTTSLSATEAGDMGTQIRWKPADDVEMDKTFIDRPQDYAEPGIFGPGDRDKNEQAGTVIAGKYTLAEVIGEGGMGSVWRARQTEPVKRFVAVKLIKAGMDSRQVLARFEAERQALAMMDHPNIAKVLDGGLHQGRPYFVMELVKGIPITDYCDRKRLTPKERLDLFVPVCQAIQHAHQKGIIHRDIKPSNVLIALYDDRPVVKVIDFGVAKATGGALTDQTLDTGFGGVVGTPQYMSPEQATFNNLDVDTRSDVYALGVLLYELLTGSPPFSRDELEKRGVLEMLRVVREEEPPRPSTKLSTADALPSLSANRSTVPSKLAGLLRNELDWIVMKALEKDRSRRYETANGFAADVQRYLAGEAVLAHPPSTGYRLRKFARKHRVGLTTTAALALLLVAGVAASTWQAVRATRAEAAARLAEGVAVRAQRAEAERAEGERLARLDAQARKAEAERAQIRAEAGEALAGERLVQVEAEKKKAEEEQQIAQAVKVFLLNKLLAQTDVSQQADALLKAGGTATEARPNPTIRELLDRAARELAPDRIEQSFPGQPRVQSEILATVGNAYRGIGEFPAAIEFLKRSEALCRQHGGPEHPSTLNRMHLLALAYEAAGKPMLAVPLFEETLRIRRATLGPEHQDTLNTMSSLAGAYSSAGEADLAVSLHEETLRIRRATLGPEHHDTIAGMSNLALAYRHAGKVDLAVPLATEALRLTKAKLGPDHPDTLSGMSNLGMLYKVAGKPGLALPLYEEALRRQKAKLGPENPSTLTTMNSLAAAYLDAGKADLGLPLMEETVKLRRATLGPEHPRTLDSMGNLALAYNMAGKADLAMPLIEETLKLRRATLGPEHPRTLDGMRILAGTYNAAGKADLAVPLYEETLRRQQAKLGPEHPDTLTTMASLAVAHLATGRADLGLPIFEETLKLNKSRLGAENPNTLIAMNNLAGTYNVVGKPDLAQPVAEEALELAKAALGSEHPITRNAQNILDLARRLLDAEDRYRREREAHGPGHIDALLALRDVAQLKLGRNQLDEAERLLDEVLKGIADRPADDTARAPTVDLVVKCLAARTRTDPDAWTVYRTKSMLGGAMLGQKNYAQAGPLLLAGYEGLKQRESSIPEPARACLPEALDRLISLSTATNQPDEVKKWQAERAKYPMAKPESLK